MSADESPEPASTVGGAYERKAEQAAKQAENYREQAKQERQFLDAFENTVMLLAQLSEQMGRLVHAMNTPKMIERDEKGKPVKITSAGDFNG